MSDQDDIEVVEAARRFFERDLRVGDPKRDWDDLPSQERSIYVAAAARWRGIFRSIEQEKCAAIMASPQKIVRERSAG
jgi:hypothetical protein